MNVTSASGKEVPLSSRERTCPPHGPSTPGPSAPRNSETTFRLGAAGDELHHEPLLDPATPRDTAARRALRRKLPARWRRPAPDDGSATSGSSRVVVPKMRELNESRSVAAQPQHFRIVAVRATSGRLPLRPMAEPKQPPRTSRRRRIWRRVVRETSTVIRHRCWCCASPEAPPAPRR